MLQLEYLNKFCQDFFDITTWDVFLTIIHENSEDIRFHCDVEDEIYEQRR